MPFPVGQESLVLLVGLRIAEPEGLAVAADMHVVVLVEIAEVVAGAEGIEATMLAVLPEVDTASAVARRKTG